MSMPYYVAPEQVMKDRAEYAQKGIARGRSLVATTYDGASLIVAENPSRSLHKISEIYDRIAFGGVGKYNEYDQLRVAGVRHADTKGYAYSREDVDARSLANLYAQYPRQRLHPRDEAARGRDPGGRAGRPTAGPTSCTTSPTRARSPTRSASPSSAATPRPSPSGWRPPGRPTGTWPPPSRRPRPPWPGPTAPWPRATSRWPR
jgi:hypothetical protein